MTLRIYTYLTLAAGVPTVAGTYFDPRFTEMDVELGGNSVVQQARNGMPLVVHDNQLQLPVAGRFSVLSTHVDLKSEVAYLGDFRYLAPVLYIHWLNHVPICIFRENLESGAKKSFLCEFAPGGFDKALAAQVVTITDQRTRFERLTPVHAFGFDFVIIRDGEYTDIDDITTAVWFDRF